jgi:hypothetical protein
VIADVHTHPGTGVRQSGIDARNPMVARRGHVGIILPRFAQGRIDPADVGFHVYDGRRGWESHFEQDAARRIRLEWLSRAPWRRR